MAAPATPALRAFVRDTLGCTCQEVVFDAVARTDLVVDGQAAGTRLVIGDRLLIYLVEREVPPAAIGVLAAAGSADRDRHGNENERVVACPESPYATSTHALSITPRSAEKR